jgi:hypothetical protein
VLTGLIGSPVETLLRVLDAILRLQYRLGEVPNQREVLAKS